MSEQQHEGVAFGDSFGDLIGPFRRAHLSALNLVPPTLNAMVAELFDDALRAGAVFAHIAQKQLESLLAWVHDRTAPSARPDPRPPDSTAGNLSIVADH